MGVISSNVASKEGKCPVEVRVQQHGNSEGMEEEGGVEETQILNSNNVIGDCEGINGGVEERNKVEGDIIGESCEHVTEKCSFIESGEQTEIAIIDDDRVTEEVVQHRETRLPNLSKPYNPFESKQVKGNINDFPPGFEEVYLDKSVDGAGEGHEPLQESENNNPKATTKKEKRRMKKLRRKVERQKLISSEDEEEEDLELEARKTWELGEAIGLRTSDVSKVHEALKKVIKDRKKGGKGKGVELDL